MASFKNLFLRGMITASLFGGAAPTLTSQNGSGTVIHASSEAEGVIRKFLSTVTEQNWESKWNAFQKDHPTEARALDAQIQYYHMSYGPEQIKWNLIRMATGASGPYQTMIKDAAASCTAATVVVTQPTAGAGAGTGASTAASGQQMEPQAAYDLLWERMEATYATKTDAAARLKDAKIHLEELKQTNRAVFNVITEEAAAQGGKKATNSRQRATSGGGDAAADYVVFLMTAETDTTAASAGEQLDTKIVEMQHEVAIKRVQDMADGIGAINAQVALFGKDIKEIKKAKNKERMSNTTGTIGRMAVNTLFNALLGSLEKEADTHNNEKVSEAIRNMRYIFEDATRTREVGSAGNDVWGEMAKQWQNTESIKDEVTRVKAQQRVLQKVEAQMRADCREYCRANGISDDAMNKQITKAIADAKLDLGIGAVGPRVPQNPMSPETLDKIKGLSAEFQTALAAAEEKPDFDTVGNLIRSEKNFAATLKYAPKGGGPGRGA